MRRYRFRLEPVLGVRRSEQDLARGGVMAAQTAVNAQEKALAGCLDAYSAALTAQGPRCAADFLVETAHRTALADAVLQQRRRLSEAQVAVDQARVVLTAAAARVGALERLDERQRAEHTAHALREEDLIVDDLVVARFGRADR